MMYSTARLSQGRALGLADSAGRKTAPWGRIWPVGLDLDSMGFGPVSIGLRLRGRTYVGGTSYKESHLVRCLGAGRLESLDDSKGWRQQ